ncbi:MAG: shikimate kinase [Cyclobacteriaceae bacterium]|nr:shikimate kinase [Cyclobacteriaceae bacterium]
MMKVFLVGLPGSGKTTLGKLLSKLMSMDFYDLDDEIEISEGRSINDIFRDKGEVYFREKEKFHLDRLIKLDKNIIISTGGGTPVFHNNMDSINKAGISVFIDITPQLAAQRIYHSEKKARPMVKDLSEEQVVHKVKELYTFRIPFYSQATLSFKTGNKDSSIFAGEIKKAILNHLDKIGRNIRF